MTPHSPTQNQLSPPESLYKAATSSIRSALILVRGGQQYVPLALTLMEQIKSLVPLYQAAVETGDNARYALQGVGVIH